MNKIALLIILLFNFEISITSQNIINYPIKSGSINYSLQIKDIEKNQFYILMIMEILNASNCKLKLTERNYIQDIS